MAVLYRKYRPQTFAEVSGQDHVKRTLAQEVAGGRLAHAYLFTGPRGVGKTTLARILAKAVNCTGRPEGSGEPCGECDSCRDVTAGRSLDVIEIDAASNTGVDNVREQIVEQARLAPVRSRYKVYIIDEVHMLSGAAFNALLKTLEEPPAHVIFILATTELHKVPATVVSRCQRFDFRKIPAPELSARLRDLAGREGVEIAPEVVDCLCRHSEGCLRDAESLLSQMLATGAKNLTPEAAALVLPVAGQARSEDLARAVAARDAVAALALWDEIAGSGADLSRAVADLMEIVRRAALAGLRGSPEAGRTLPPAAAAALLRRLTAVRDEMRRAEIPELPFEMLIMEWSDAPVVVSHERSSGGATGGAASGSPERAPACPRQTGRQLLVSTSGVEAATGPVAPLPSSSPAPEVAASGISLGDVRGRWIEVLRNAQERHHSLPYMLGATEIMACDDGVLTLGFQYALYRDRLNEIRHREHLEAALKEIFGTPLRVKAVLTAQKVDGTVEPVPGLSVEPGAKLPDGFADLAKEFGASV